MRTGDRVTVTVLGERVAATVEGGYATAGIIRVWLDYPVDVDGVPVYALYRDRSDVEPLDDRAPEVASWVNP